ncbi:MAG: sensor domain-containing diguanylate cyclase [Acidimicrobiales bacterium]|nr:sensor domain-containing diguanylate cyclase [Acidimicrobiales bacterium]
MTRSETPPAGGSARPDLVDEAFLADMVRASFHPYVVLAADGTILFAGDAVDDLIGIPADQLVGTNMADVLDPESRDRAIEAFQEFTSPDRPTTGWVGPALTIKLRHVAGHSISCRALAVPSGNPEFDGLVLWIRRTESNDRLDAAIASLVQGDDVETTLSRMLEFASEQMPYSVGAAGLGFDGSSFTTVVADPRAPRLLPNQEILPLEDSSTPWRVVLDGNSEVHVDADDLAEPIRTAAAQAGFLGCWAFALDQRTPHRDVLVFWRRAPGGPGPHLTEGIARIIRLIQLALEGDRTRRLLEKQANTDELTGLANRSLLYAELEVLRDHPPDRPFGILYCDLDDFKPINDELGHSMGDRVLQIAARRIAGQVRADDLAARIGGDEFAVLCPGTTTEALSQLADRVIGAFAEPITVQDEEISLGISVGAALLDPTDHPIDPSRVLDRADGALLQAKASGKGRWKVATHGS